MLASQQSGCQQLTVWKDGLIILEGLQEGDQITTTWQMCRLPIWTGSLNICSYRYMSLGRRKRQSGMRIA